MTPLQAYSEDLQSNLVTINIRVPRPVTQEDRMEDVSAVKGKLVVFEDKKLTLPIRDAVSKLEEYYHYEIDDKLIFKAFMELKPLYEELDRIGRDRALKIVAVAHALRNAGRDEKEIAEALKSL